MKILLQNGMKVIINDVDASLVSGLHWFARKEGNVWYACSKKNYKTIKMHRLLLGAKQGESVDHIDGNGLNNSRLNLRLDVSASQNRINSKKDKNATSRYKGVSVSSHNRGRWLVHVCKDRNQEYLGTYKSEFIAALKRDVRALELFGDFARLNFPIIKKLRELNMKEQSGNAGVL